MDFGDAIRALKTGTKVTRAGWNGKGMHLYLEKEAVKARWTFDGAKSDENNESSVWIGEKIVFEPFIVMFTAQGKHQPGWLASQADMLAEDWEVLP